MLHGIKKAQRGEFMWSRSFVSCRCRRSIPALPNHASVVPATRPFSTAASSSSPLAEAHPDAVVAAMRAEKLRRGYLVWSPEKQRVLASHPMFEPLAADITTWPDFDRHEGIFFEVGPVTGALHFASLHTTTRGPGAGGVRYWPYHKFRDAVRDGMRLARGMGRKNALAGLWWGGGKGVIARSPHHDWRDQGYRNILFREYGVFMTSLQGCYVTAEDVGVKTPDMLQIFRNTRFTTCIPSAVGGSGNPSVVTGHGVVCGIEAALEHLGKGTLEGKSVAVQGVGNVSVPMIQRLLERGVASVVAADVDEVAVANGRNIFKGAPVTLRHVAEDDCSILYEDVDVVAPCALGAVLNKDTIPNIRAPVVCGAANNQLKLDDEDAERIKAAGITFVPDYVANRMGIVNCANEQHGYVQPDPTIQRHFSRDYKYGIFQVTTDILQKAQALNITTQEAAASIADVEAQVPHPIWPDRPRQIIQSLVTNQWQDGASVLDP